MPKTQPVTYRKGAGVNGIDRRSTDTFIVPLQVYRCGWGYLSASFAELRRVDGNLSDLDRVRQGSNAEGPREDVSG